MEKKFLEYLPDCELWRLFIDGYRQSRGWIKFETEPGYLLAMGTAFAYGYQNFDKNKHTLIDLIKTLHHLAISRVSNTNYDNKNIDSKEFNAELKVKFKLKCYKTGKANTLTSNGLRQIIEKITLGRSLTTNTDLLKNIHTKKLPLTVTKTETSTTPVTKTNLQGLIGSVEDSAFPKNVESLYLHRDKLSNAVMNQIIKSYLSIYEKNIRLATNWERKLEVIINLIQDLEQAHPFYDGNLRTFAMLLLQFLLAVNGMPCAILNDPNVFDGYSREELKNEVIVGMRNFLSLLNKNYINDKDIDRNTAHDIMNYTAKSKVQSMSTLKSQDIIKSQGELPKKLREWGYNDQDEYYQEFLYRIKNDNHEKTLQRQSFNFNFDENKSVNDKDKAINEAINESVNNFLERFLSQVRFRKNEEDYLDKCLQRTIINYISQLIDSNYSLKIFNNIRKTLNSINIKDKNIFNKFSRFLSLLQDQEAPVKEYIKNNINYFFEGENKDINVLKLLTTEIENGTILDEQTKIEEHMLVKEEHMLVKNVVNYLKANNVKKHQIDNYIKSNREKIKAEIFYCYYQDVGNPGVVLEKIKNSLNNVEIKDRVKSNYGHRVKSNYGHRGSLCQII